MKEIYKTKICQVCGKEYQPTDSTQKYCPECIPAVKAKRDAKRHEKNPEKKKKSDAKRRFMSWNPLNSPFPDCESHHINLTDVIYIPRTMHDSVSHNIWTGRGMEKINALAYQWLAKET